MVYPFADDLISPACVCLREIKIKATYLRVENSGHILIVARCIDETESAIKHSIASNRVPIFRGVDKTFLFHSHPSVLLSFVSPMAGIYKMTKKGNAKCRQKQPKIAKSMLAGFVALRRIYEFQLFQQAFQRIFVNPFMTNVLQKQSSIILLSKK
jgi:hypothetical protein